MKLGPASLSQKKGNNCHRVQRSSRQYTNMNNTLLIDVLIFQITELLNMGTINSKKHVCVRQHVKNIYNLEIDQAMELNIKL